MDRGVGAAARLPESDREELAIQALARSEPVSDLAARHGVSRKFVYAQTHKARIALDDAFLSATAEDEVLFELTVTAQAQREPEIQPDRVADKFRRIAIAGIDRVSTRRHPAQI